MKKKFLFIVFMMLALTASASVEIDGIYYNLNSETRTAEVTYGTKEYLGDIVIPASITSDGVTYSVTSIGEEAFEQCRITSVDMSNNITSIGREAFWNCYQLTSITIPANVTSLEGVFAGCYELTKVEIHSDALVSKDYNWLSGGLLYNLFGNYVQEFVIGEEVTKIGKCAFWGCTSLTSITIPNSVTTIGSGSFSGCEKLTSITIPSSVTSIEDNPFNACSGLLSIQVEEGNTVYDSRNSCNAIIKTADNEIITGCQNTIIPNSVKSIGAGAFHMCNGLTFIDIPSSVTTIKGGAFWFCKGLASISIPNSVTTIGEQAFEGCSALTSVNIPNGLSTIENEVFSGCKIASITIPNSVTTIGEDAFGGCPLTSLTIPNSVVSIANTSFASCAYTLTAIQVESGNTIYDSRDNCNAIINSADNTLILGCQNTIIPNNVEKIGDYAFSSCGELSSIDIPNSVKSIGDYAFIGCRKLGSVNIPYGVTTIGENAFYNCSELKTIILPKTITKIGNMAFNSWGSKDVYCYAEQLPELGEGVFFAYSGTNATLHVPATSIETYKGAEQWKDFGSIVALTDDDPKPTAISTMEYAPTTYNKAIYDLQGHQLAQPKKGLNIIRMSDGTTKKVVIK
jgi:hypothetical protein